MGSSSPGKFQVDFANHLPTYLSQISPHYLEWLHQLYQQERENLPFEWQIYFDGLSSSGVVAISPKMNVYNEINALQLIEAYRNRGHLLAHINPLEDPPPANLYEKCKLNLENFSLHDLPSSTMLEAAGALGLPPSNIKTLEAHLKKTYSYHMGVEYQHISDNEAQEWLQKKMESSGNQTKFTKEERLSYLEDLAAATFLERFLQENFTGQKRFSLEGAESLIPGLKGMAHKAVELGVKELVFGMAHRGRLNFLANFMNKPYEKIFGEFQGLDIDESSRVTGDVKYHLGHSSDIEINGSHLHISLAFNPSHLEAVDPVLEGLAWAKQHMRYGGDKAALVPVLIHGEAAVIGQGVVMETLNLSGLPGYHTGGTIHFIINNQIGFTTTPSESRSTHYATAFAKAIEAPIFHVNGSQVEAVVHAAKLAMEFRMKFRRDVFIDLYCFRKYGHNEGDEPRFTQPLMYQKIERHPSILHTYISQLTNMKIIDHKAIKELEKQKIDEMEMKLRKVKEGEVRNGHDYLGGDWREFIRGEETDLWQFCPTAINDQMAREIIELIHHIPEGIQPLPKFKRMLEKRKQKIYQEEVCDWAVAEQFAIGSLLKEGHGVRLTGQDTVRGTFGHRHLAIFDHLSGEIVIPLKTLESAKAKLWAFNSPLSEYACLGFEFGHSISSPQVLTIWEAQFGDFINGAQIIIDQFLVSSESKWLRMSGLVLLLPHGHEGQGPEHSSARPERFLQLYAEGNIQVAYPTTAAQYFHLLRRQIHRKFRRPLIVLTPKGYLRRPEVNSPLSEFLEGGFRTILYSGAEPQKAKKVILCSGKLYWELVEEAQAQGVWEETAFIRLEQLAPLNVPELRMARDQYKQAKSWLWVQEEPQNMGAWIHIYMATRDFLNLSYVGRPRASSPATGSPRMHRQEQDKILHGSIEIKSLETDREVKYG